MSDENMNESFELEAAETIRASDDVPFQIMPSMVVRSGRELVEDMVGDNSLCYWNLL